MPLDNPLVTEVWLAPEGPKLLDMPRSVLSALGTRETLREALYAYLDWVFSSQPVQYAAGGADHWRFEHAYSVLDFLLKNPHGDIEVRLGKTPDSSTTAQ